MLTQEPLKAFMIVCQGGGGQQNLGLPVVVAGDDAKALEREPVFDKVTAHFEVGHIVGRWSPILQRRIFERMAAILKRLDELTQPRVAGRFLCRGKQVEALPEIPVEPG